MNRAPALAVLALAAAALGLAGAAPANPETVAYTATPVLQDGKLTALEISISFRGDADGETVLALPDRWAGEVEYWRHIEGLQIAGADARKRDEASHVLTHAP